MPARQLIPDAVWAELDPRAGRLSRRGRRAVLAVFITALLVLILSALAGACGAIVPRLGIDPYMSRADPADHTIVVGLDIHNRASFALHVAALSSHDDAFSVASAPTPFVVPGHATRTVNITLNVRSCANLHGSAVVPVVMSVDHWWGDLDYPLLTSDSGALEAATRLVCHRDGP